MKRAFIALALMVAIAAIVAATACAPAETALALFIGFTGYACWLVAGGIVE